MPPEDRIRLLLMIETTDEAIGFVTDKTTVTVELPALRALLQES